MPIHVSSWFMSNKLIVISALSLECKLFSYSMGIDCTCIPDVSAGMKS